MNPFNNKDDNNRAATDAQVNNNSEFQFNPSTQTGFQMGTSTPIPRVKGSLDRAKKRLNGLLKGKKIQKQPPSFPPLRSGPSSYPHAPYPPPTDQIPLSHTPLSQIPPIPPSPVTSKQAAPRVGSNENRELRFEHEIQTLTAIALALLKDPNQPFYKHPFKKEQNGCSVRRELKPYDLYTSNDASPTPLDYQFQVFHKRRSVSVFVRYDNKPIVPKGKEGLEHCAKAFAAYFVMMTKNEKAAIVKPLHDAIDWQTQKTAFGKLFYYNKTNCFASYKKYDEIFEEFFRTYLTIFLLAMGFDSAFDLELEDSMGIEEDEATAAIELFDCLATDIDAAMSPDGLDSPTKDTNPTTKSSKKNSDNEPPQSNLTTEQLIYNLMELRLNNNKEEKVARANADKARANADKARAESDAAAEEHLSKDYQATLDVLGKRNRTVDDDDDSQDVQDEGNGEDDHFIRPGKRTRNEKQNESSK